MECRKISIVSLGTCLNKIGIHNAILFYAYSKKNVIVIFLLFSSLQILSMGGNQITDVPESVGALTSLQALVLSNNAIEQLPASIANLKQLRSLLIHQNKLKTLPTQIIKLKCLTEVSIILTIII